MLVTFRSRIQATLLLTPAIMLLLVWIGRFAGTEEIAKMGLLQFSLWALGAGFGISAMVTLYISYLCKSASKG